MEQQAGLQDVRQKSEELFTWYVALQEAGFNEMMAFALLQPLILTGVIRHE